MCHVIAMSRLVLHYANNQNNTRTVGNLWRCNKITFCSVCVCGYFQMDSGSLQFKAKEVNDGILL